MADATAANPDLLRGTGGVVTGMGGSLAAVGTAVQIFPVAALAPIFGPIGAHYLGAFAASTAKQALGIGTLGSSVSESGVWTIGSGNTFDSGDSVASDAFDAAGEGLGT